MTFDVTKFESTKFKPREESIPVPELAAFFAEGDDPVWVVRGLEGRQVAEANAAVNTNKALVELLKKVSGNAKEKADAAMAALGSSEKTPDDLVRRYNLLVVGSVAPAITKSQAVRLARYFPVTFYALTNKILELTGHGPLLPGESSASGGTPGCEAPSHSAPEAGLEGVSTDSSTK